MKIRSNMTPNHSVNRTAHKLRLRVPSALRARRPVTSNVKHRNNGGKFAMSNSRTR